MNKRSVIFFIKWSGVISGLDNIAVPHPLHLLSPPPAQSLPPPSEQTYIFNSILYITYYIEDTDNHKIVSTNRRVVHRILLCGPIAKEERKYI